MSSDEDKGYVTQNNVEVPVQSDERAVEDPIDDAKADTDEQVVKDENEAIDRSNIINERTRGATKPSGTYQEPGDEEGMPNE